MSAKGITDELVQQVADDLRARHGLDDQRREHRVREALHRERRETFAPFAEY